MCKTLDFTDLYEKESRSTFHFTQKRYKDNIGTSVRKVCRNENNFNLVAINVCTDFREVYCDNIISEIDNLGGYFQCCDSNYLKSNKRIEQWICGSKKVEHERSMETNGLSQGSVTVSRYGYGKVMYCWKFLRNWSDFTGCFDMEKYDGKELEENDMKRIFKLYLKIKSKAWSLARKIVLGKPI